MSPALRVCVFLPSLAGGGAERVTMALAEGLNRDGCEVDLVVGTSAGPLHADLPPRVPLRDLGVRRTLFAVPRLLRHLRRERPDVLIAAISHANIVAAVTARLLRPRVRVIVIHHNTTSISTRDTGNRRDRLLPLLCGLAYRLADRVIAVSHGVAADLAASSHLPAERIQVIANPIDYDSIRLRSSATIDPAALPAGTEPLVVAAGRLERQKGFDVLIRAAAQAQQPWRLVILGDGVLKQELSTLVSSLGVADRVSLPGFVANPYPYFRAATVFALSSRWEGLPTVLVESLAFDLRIVATDCPSGPREILSDVDGSELVAVEDSASLAAEIDRAVAAGRITSPRQQWRRYETDHVMALISDTVREVAGRP